MASDFPRTSLKAVFRKHDSTISSSILNDSLKCQYIFFLYAFFPQLALNDPVTFNAMLEKFHININSVCPPSTFYSCFDPYCTAKLSKEIGHSLLVVSPVFVD